MPSFPSALGGGHPGLEEGHLARDGARALAVVESPPGTAHEVSRERLGIILVWLGAGVPTREPRVRPVPPWSHLSEGGIMGIGGGPAAVPQEGIPVAASAA